MRTSLLGIGSIGVPSGYLTGLVVLKLTSSPMIRWLVGKDPFEALALLRMVGGHSRIEAVWRRAPLLGRGFLLVCRLEREDGWTDRAHKGPVLQLDKSPCVGQTSSCGAKSSCTGPICLQALD